MIRVALRVRVTKFDHIRQENGRTFENITEIDNHFFLYHYFVVLVRDGLPLICDGLLLIGDGLLLIRDDLLLIRDGLLLVGDGLLVVGDGVLAIRLCPL